MSLVLGIYNHFCHASTLKATNFRIEDVNVYMDS
jgi:hypothetical protein